METQPDLLTHNQMAWDHAVEQGDHWTIPVSAEALAQARQGQPQLVLTPLKPIPQEWLQPLAGKQVLCLASGGGQQGPLLAAAGAEVTVFDNSPQQLAQDQKVAELEQLPLKTVQGDMRDLAVFADSAFDLIVHPVSNCFVDSVLPVWREAYRVLKPGGRLLSGFNNPLLYSYDPELEAQGILQLKYPLPFSTFDLPAAEIERDYLQAKRPFEFGHSLSDQIGGQLAAGFLLAGFYEDHWHRSELHNRFFPHFIATMALKPELNPQH